MKKFLLAHAEPRILSLWAPVIDKHPHVICDDLDAAECAFDAELRLGMPFTHVVIGSFKNVGSTDLPASLALIRKMRMLDPTAVINAVSAVEPFRKEMVLAGASFCWHPMEVAAQLHQLATRETANTP